MTKYAANRMKHFNDCIMAVEWMALIAIAAGAIGWFALNDPAKAAVMGKTFWAGLITCLAITPFDIFWPDKNEIDEFVAEDGDIKRLQKTCADFQDRIHTIIEESDRVNRQKDYEIAKLHQTIQELKLSKAGIDSGKIPYDMINRVYMEALRQGKNVSPDPVDQFIKSIVDRT